MEQRAIAPLQQEIAAQLIPAGHETLRVAGAGRWRLAWKRRLVIIALVASDALLALLVWEATILLQRVWNPELSFEVWAITVVPVTAIWVAIRALLGLYPGYGLNSVEQLRLHTYATFAALGMLAIFAAGFQVGERLSRLSLIVTFLGLLLLTPLVRYSTKLGVRAVGSWGQPVVILSYGETKTEIVNRLSRTGD